MSLKWDQTNAARKARERRERGQCANCQSPASPGRSRCEDCRRIHQESVKAWRTRPETPMSEEDRKLTANGRCRCGLLLPCEVCLPTTAMGWQAYAGGSER